MERSGVAGRQQLCATDRPDDGREINTCTRRPFPTYRNRGMGGTPLHYRVIRLKADSAADQLLIKSSKVTTAGWRGEPQSCGLRPAAGRHVHKILFRLQPPIRGQQVGDGFILINRLYLTPLSITINKLFFNFFYYILELVHNKYRLLKEVK